MPEASHPRNQEANDLELHFTEIFKEWRAKGKPDTEIFAEASAELKELAKRMTAGQPAGASLTASRLCNDAFIKLFGNSPSDFRWEQAHDFFIAVARAMHNLKVDYIRRKMAVIHGGGRVQSLDELQGRKGFEAPAIDAIQEDELDRKNRRDRLDRALRRLRQEYPDREKAIVLTYWGDDNNTDGLPQNRNGLTQKQVAAILEVDAKQVDSLLRTGRARLKHYLTVDT